MNSNILKSIIKLNNDRQSDLADFLGIKSSTLSFKINGKTDFSRAEIKLIKNRYNLTATELDEIFF